MGPNKNYPGLAITENQWKLEEVEQEFRAQIVFTLKHVPQISHLSGHMGSTGFHPDVAKMVSRLSEEYDLPVMSREINQELGLSGVTYNGPKGTSAEKEASFIRMLEKLEAGKSYMFVDHPSYDNIEMQGLGHIGYEDVAMDRQGVTDTWTSVLRESKDLDWAEWFLAFPMEHQPGNQFVYNSLATYMHSAILTRVTGERALDYLQPRLLRQLGIVEATWEESPQGIQIGGWGLKAKTEDMAKLGLLAKKQITISILFQVQFSLRSCIQIRHSVQNPCPDISIPFISFRTGGNFHQIKPDNSFT